MFSAFLRSCEKIAQKNDDEPANTREKLAPGRADRGLGGRIADWREPCAQARVINGPNQKTRAATRSSIRAFFEFYFQPMQIHVRRDPLPDGRARRAGPSYDADAVFTGYFEPSYGASRQRTQQYQSPLYPRPDDLVDVDLGAFRAELKGERIAGRLAEGRLVPYWDRRAINDGALADQAEPLAWLMPDDLFFLQIQGSGQLIYSPGDTDRMGYAAQNGHAYTAIGRVLVERSLMRLDDVTMQSIRDWLDNAGAQRARELREENASYVFFRKLDNPVGGLGPPGAQGVALTPERSLAVDPRFHMLGAPVWVDIEPLAGVDDSRIQRLMIAQDTGGAIKGPLRGDVFWGAGSHAADVAGRMNARGNIYILAPKSVVGRLYSERAPK